MLVDELPPEPEPEAVAEPEEEAVAEEAPGVPIGRGALSGPRLFLWSARRAARMGNLWVLFGAVVLIGSVLALVQWEHLPAASRPPVPLSMADYVQTGLQSLEWDWTDSSTVAHNLPSGLVSPLRKSLTLFAAPAQVVGALARLLGGGQGKGTAADWLFYAASLLVDALVFGLLLAGIYGWVQNGLLGDPLTLRGFGASAKRHWRALFAWGAAVAAITLLVVLVYPMPAYGSDGYWSARVARTTLTTWLQLPLALAPFLVVAQGAGFLGAFTRSLRLVREQWLALLALVVLYRAGDALLTFAGFPLHVIRTNLWLPALDPEFWTPGLAAGVAAGLAILVLESLAWVWLGLTLCTALLALALPEGNREEPEAVAEPGD